MEEMKTTNRILLRKSEQKKPLERPKYRWDDKI
jgi:hypothetical protein